MEPNDTFLLKTIVGYCSDAETAIRRFDLSEEIVTDDDDFKALLAFYVLQIGEAAGKLSEKFKVEHPEIEWKAIVGFRHHIVHAYGKVIPALLWDSVIDDVPKLREFCVGVLSGNEAK